MKKDWCREKGQFSVLRRRLKFLFVEQMPFYLASSRTSYLFHCSGFGAILVNRACWLKLSQPDTPEIVNFILEYVLSASLNLCKKESYHIDWQDRGNAFLSQHTCSQRFSALISSKSTLNGRFGNHDAGFLHPISRNRSSYLHERWANWPCILRGIIVYYNLLDLDKIGCKSFSTQTALNISGSCMMATAASNQNKVEYCSFEFKVSLISGVLMCLAKPWITANIHFLQFRDL